ncbi:YisL family protein [Sporosarcina sp. G11-34]|uniref:YisL family protein n=1 Tax=Sporosarcina sp. G11-34 TaxID=2849605 RepID=UPI0022A986A3|nr:YisL family protein [Sporosarcina sp. G11-34]MCZ2259011.1 YisL family protein [Sporosarcina sp. G11-34]
MDFLSNTTHLHIFTWVVGVILFLVAAVMASGSKGQKIVHMTARLFYVLILLSGLLLFIRYMSMDGALYGVKFLLGFATIGMMEMVLVRSNKGKSVSVLWILFFVFLFATMFLGFKLPIGIDWFA